MGMSLDPRAVHEDSDVFFECHIKANPKYYKLKWFHEVSLLLYQTARNMTKIVLNINHIYAQLLQ